MNNINYYNKNHKSFIENTLYADMSFLYNKFQTYCKSGLILDLGCGSGRDSLYFGRQGYEVIAIDGSEQLVNYCKYELNLQCECSTFENYQTNMRFDGIWASASLLHVEKEKISTIINKYTQMLKKDGFFLMSFKNRGKDFEKDGRSFTCFTPTSLRELLKSIIGIELLEIIETKDVRENRDNEQWVTAIIKRI